MSFFARKVATYFLRLFDEHRGRTKRPPWSRQLREPLSTKGIHGKEIHARIPNFQDPRFPPEVAFIC